jgi:hypothetical protein
MKTKLLGLFAAALMIIGMAPQKASANDGHLIGTIIGAATGAFIGSNVGKGKGKIAATAVGTLIGAAIGTDIARQSGGNRQVATTPVYRPSYPRSNPPVYSQTPARPRVVHKTKIVKHVHVHENNRKFKNHKQVSKWQKRQNRKHRRYADARHDNSCGRYQRNCQSWN